MRNIWEEKSPFMVERKPGGIEAHGGNGMIPRKIREEGEPKVYHPFSDPDFLFELGAELARNRFGGKHE